MDKPAKKRAVVVHLKGPREGRTRGHRAGRLVGRNPRGELLVETPSRGIKRVERGSVEIN
jgi:hypothetical protein